MAAYIIGRVNVTDPEQYAKYMARTPEVVASFGGKFIARGGPKETLEGPEETNRVVILEFPSYQRARDFFHSDAYQQVKQLRLDAADAQFVLIDQWQPPQS